MSETSKALQIGTIFHEVCEDAFLPALSEDNREALNIWAAYDQACRDAAPAFTGKEMKLGKLQRKWVRLLRSGKYKQGKKCLKVGDKYCCLGLACEHVLAIPPENSGLRGSGEIVWQFEGNGGLPSRAAAGKLGLRTVTGDYAKDFPAGCVSLSSDNDRGTTFPEIADIIVKYKNSLFRESL